MARSGSQEQESTNRPAKEPLPNQSTSSREGTPTRGSLLDSPTLRAAGTFLGIVGTGGGGFAALSFGIGYLAIKNHDAMVGLPTTVASYTAYVRTGSLFFPNSIYYTFSAIIPHLLKFSVAALGILLAFRLVARDSHVRNWLDKIVDPKKWATPELLLFITAHIALLALGVSLVQLQLAAFDPMNKKLLFTQIIERERLLTSSTAPGNRGPNPTKAVANKITAEAKEINADLLARDGAERLQGRYGEELVLVILFVYFTVIMRLWRRRLRPRAFPVIDWAARPILYGLVLVSLLNLPATYGILTLSNSGEWVTIYIAGGEGAGKAEGGAKASGEESFPGYLLTDLSSGAEEVWILGKDEMDKWVFKKYERQEIMRIHLDDFSPNILVVK